MLVVEEALEAGRRKERAAHVGIAAEDIEDLRAHEQGVIQLKKLIESQALLGQRGSRCCGSIGRCRDLGGGGPISGGGDRGDRVWDTMLDLEEILHSVRFRIKLIL